MSESTWPDASSDAPPPDPEADGLPQHAAGPITGSISEPMAEPEVRAAPDAGAMHWQAQPEPGGAADDPLQHRPERGGD